MILNQPTTTSEFWPWSMRRVVAAIGMIVMIDSPVGSPAFGQETDQKEVTELVFAIQEPKGISDIVASRDGTTVFTTSYGTKPKLWDVRTGKPRADTPAKDFAVDIGFSPDGRFGISTGWSRTQLWDAASGKPSGPTLKHIMDESSVIMPVCSEKGDLIATVDSPYTVRVWNIKTGRARTDPLPHKPDLVDWMRFSPDGKRFLTEGHNRVRVWDTKTSRLLAGPFTIRKWSEPVMNSDCTRMVTYIDDETLEIIDLRNGKPIGGQLGHESYVHMQNPAFGPGGLLLTYDEGGAWLWSQCDTEKPRSKKVVPDLRIGRAFFLPELKDTMRPDQDSLSTNVRFVTLSSSRLAVWQVGRKQPLWEQAVKRFPRSLTASRDGRWLLFRTTRNPREQIETAYVFDAETGRKVFEENSLVTATIEHDLVLTAFKTGANIWRLPQPSAKAATNN